MQFNSPAYTVGEGGGSVTITVVRGGDTSAAAKVYYATQSDGPYVKCDVVGTGKALERCDFTTTAGVLRFAAAETQKSFTVLITDDAYVEGPESVQLLLSNPVGASLGAVGTATLTITDNDTVPAALANNPFNSNEFFVRQHYLDFLSREPDQGGFDSWTGVLSGCGPERGGLGSPTGCDRVHVSSGFYRSPEFTDRGYFVYRFYEAVLARLPRYSEFVPDTASLSGFTTPQEQEQNVAEFIASFMARPEFVSRYGSAIPASGAAGFVQQLEQTAGATLPENVPATRAGQPEQVGRSEMIRRMGAGERTAAQTLRSFVEQQALYDKFFFRGFVAMQYFGYLRRDPEQAGYDDWVDVMTNGRGTVPPSDYRHMIFGFIYSAEYRERFGQP